MNTGRSFLRRRRGAVPGGAGAAPHPGPRHPARLLVRHGPRARGDQGPPRKIITVSSYSRLKYTTDLIIIVIGQNSHNSHRSGLAGDKWHHDLSLKMYSKIQKLNDKSNRYINKNTPTKQYE